MTPVLYERDPLLGTSRLAVWLAVVTNRLFFASIVLGLLLSWIFSSRFASMLPHEASQADLHSEMTGLRLLMGIGVAMALGIGVLLAALSRILASAHTGEPFAAANAQRLRVIAWALLALQLLDLPAALTAKFFPILGDAAPDVGFSPGGWIAVLMVFVLSRVFDAGATMKNDLEGTV